MNCLSFELETPYLVNFRKPFSTITILSYSFPPYTTIRGLLANSLGLERDDYSLQERFKVSLKPLNEPGKSQNMVLMKKLKSNLSKNESDISKKVENNKGYPSILSEEERIVFEGLKHIRSSSAPFIKEYVTPVLCKIFVLGEEKDIHELRKALEDPARPLYIGASDDFVVISNIKLFNAKETKSNKIDSIIRLNEQVEPTDKRRIVGRVPYKFAAINTKKRDYSREDAIVAAPKPGAKLELNESVECYEIGDEYVAF
jgi:CRISPR-associated protein Cas5h